MLPLLLLGWIHQAKNGEEEVERTLSDVGRRILAVAARRESDTSLVELANNVCEGSKITTPQK